MTIYTAQFSLTEKCNLNCSYCYVNQKEISLTKEKFHKHYDSLKKKLKTSDKYKFHFFGGEPLLQWDLLTYITYFLKKDEQCLEKIIFSNGRLLTQNKVNFLKENNIKFVVSFDGMWEPYTRPLKNNEDPIKSFKKKLPLIKQLTNFATCMVTPDHLNLVENYNFFLDELTMIPNFKIVRDDIWDDASVNKFAVEMDKLCDRYAELLENKHQNCLPDIIGGYLIKMKTGLFENKKALGCQAGSKHLCYGSDGEIYSCERFASEKLKINIPQEEYEECKECPINEICDKGCPYQNIKNGNKPIANVCKLYLNIYSSIIKLNKRLKNNPFWGDIIKNLLENKPLV